MPQDAPRGSAPQDPLQPGHKANDRWADLGTRLISGSVVVLVGSAAVIAGGVWFQMLAVFASAVMVWEIWTMIEPKGQTRGMLLAAMAASVLSGKIDSGPEWALVLFLVVPTFGALVAPRERWFFFFFAFGIQVAGWGLVSFRNDYGFTWLLWLILVVAATDMAGYFAGRSIGGPRFWPRLSPKKTWSGTVAGWLAAGAVGGLFDLFFVAVGPQIIPLSMILSFASQLGDIAESGFKRRMGAKDSSALIPGHGGLFDRFDALLGASLFMLAFIEIFGIPGVAF